MFAKRDKHYPSRSEQTSLATAVTNFTKPVAKINLGPVETKPCNHCNPVQKLVVRANVGPANIRMCQKIM